MAGRPDANQAGMSDPLSSPEAVLPPPTTTGRPPAPPADSGTLRDVLHFRVIYGDTDQMGVVYYANYFRYFEAARSEFLRAYGVTYRFFEETHRLALPVVEAGATYKKPARYDDELAVLAAITSTGRASVRFVYEIRRLPTLELLATGHTVHACINQDGRVAPLPDDLRHVLALSSPPEKPRPASTEASG
jgi:acyl-CoA thioester hydrolase